MEVILQIEMEDGTRFLTKKLNMTSDNKLKFIPYVGEQEYKELASDELYEIKPVGIS